MVLHAQTRSFLKGGAFPCFCQRFLFHFMVCTTNNSLATDTFSESLKPSPASALTPTTMTSTASASGARLTGDALAQAMSKSLDNSLAVIFFFATQGCNKVWSPVVWFQARLQQLSLCQLWQHKQDSSSCLFM